MTTKKKKQPSDESMRIAEALYGRLFSGSPYPKYKDLGAVQGIAKALDERYEAGKLYKVIETQSRRFGLRGIFQ